MPRLESVVLSTKGYDKKGRHATPSYLLLDSQSVKTSYEGECRCFHRGKKVKGRSPQIAVDTQGLMWAAHVHAANEANTLQGCVLAHLVMSEVPTVRGMCADQCYRGKFVDYVQLEWECLVDIPKREGKAFQLDPVRRVVERIFAWNNG